MAFSQWNFVLLIPQYVLICASGLTTFYFSDLCPNDRSTYMKTINLGPTWRDYNSSAILKAKRYAAYPTDLSCNVTIQPPFGHGVVAAIRRTDLRKRCSVDNLTLTDSLGVNTRVCGYKDYSEEYSSTHSSGQLTVVFKTGHLSEGSTVFNDGFQITVTSCRKYPCWSYEFKCSTPRCIAKKLKCDNHNHCGDNSDQLDCHSISVGVIVGIIFGCLFVLAFIIAGVVSFLRERNKVVTTTTIQSPPPQPPPPQPMFLPYEGMYLQPGSYPPPPEYSEAVRTQEAVNPLYN